MLTNWIMTKLAPLQEEPVIILKDPQRMIRKGAFELDAWSQDHGFTTLMCTGNLALREWYEQFRDDPNMKLLLVDRSRVNPRRPGLFYPDIQARASKNAKINLSLRNYLVEQTGDTHWPQIVDENRQIADLVLEHLPGVIHAHANLRSVDSYRFSDADFYKILFGAVLGVNPFVKLKPDQVRKLCIEQYSTFESLSRVLSEEVMDHFRELVKKTEYPFNLLLEHNPELIMRAFNLAAVLRQHNLDYPLLLGNFDSGLMTYRDIPESTLQSAMDDLIQANPDQVTEDMRKLESFLLDDPNRVELLFQQQFNVEDQQKALSILENEKLFELVRRSALFSLFIELFQTKPDLNFHRHVLETIRVQEQDSTYIVLRRPSPQWQALVELYQQSVDYFDLLITLARNNKTVKMKPDDELTFKEFENYWNRDQLNRFEYYAANVNRQMRVGDIYPMRKDQMWPGLEDRWEKARDYLKQLNIKADNTLVALDKRFQDLYQKHYTKWIYDSQSPAIFTHQFLDRVLKKHWDPKKHRKAIIMVFDGMRTEAWDLFLRPVFETRFKVEDELPGSALLPTETQLSRKAISAGRLPEEFMQGSTRESTLLENWLSKTVNYHEKFTIIKDDDTDASGITVRYESSQLDYIVFNFTDHNLHHNDQELSFIYNNTVQQIIQTDVQAVLREIPDDVIIFITSDHGFTTMPDGKLPVPQSVATPNDTKYRCVRAQARFTGHEDDVITFVANNMGIPTSSNFQYVHFPRPHLLFQRATGRHDPDKYSHGGLSMAECLIPMVVLSGKAKEQRLFYLQTVRQVNIATEGEPVDLEIEVGSSQLLEQNALLTFEFNVSNLTPHREYISSTPKIIPIQWVPELPEITMEDRQRGMIVIPLLAKMTYMDKGKAMVGTFSIDVQIRVDQNKLRRRIDSKLDLMMGKIPRQING